MNNFCRDIWRYYVSEVLTGTKQIEYGCKKEVIIEKYVNGKTRTTIEAEV